MHIWTQNEHFVFLAAAMKLILDFVPNHTSKKHRWFQESRKSRDNSYANFYVWHPGSLIGTVRQPPNNWVSS